MALRVSVPRALVSAALWRCGSQEVVCSNLSNERTFQARHCGIGSSLQPMLFSPQRNKPSYSLIPLWHLWPKCLRSHPPTATTLALSRPLSLNFLSSVLFCSCCFNFFCFAAVIVVMVGQKESRLHVHHECSSVNKGLWHSYEQDASLHTPDTKRNWNANFCRSLRLFSSRWTKIHMNFLETCSASYILYLSC